jgi:hypothetical protein
MLVPSCPPMVLGFWLLAEAAATASLSSSVNPVARLRCRADLACCEVSVGSVLFLGVMPATTVCPD